MRDSSAASSRNTISSYNVSVEQLASRLGMVVSKAGNPHVELSNSSNRVLLFMYEGGNVWVNGQRIGEVGNAVKSGGTYYVSELLIPKIRGYMISTAPVTYSRPTPQYEPSYSVRSGSGLVVIDPGHGGSDPGAQSVLGYWEKDINLKISNKVVGYLRDAGITVVMTRERDIYPELEERAALANNKNADLFVSIHCDSNGDRMHKGFTIYQARAASSDTKKAGRILERHLSDTNIPSKGLRNADYRVLVQTNCPAVLVECGFMSNYDEAALLMDPWYQNKIARAIADGIIEYL